MIFQTVLVLIVGHRQRRTPEQTRWLRSESRYGILTEPLYPWQASPKYRRVKVLTAEEIAKAYPGVAVSKK